MKLEELANVLLRCGSLWFLCFLSLTLKATVMVVGAQNPSKRTNETASCSAVRIAWGTKGLGSHSVPSSMIPGDQLHLCSQGLTCCTKSMEEKLRYLGKQEFLKTSNDALASIRQDFVTWTTKFEAFCIELIENSTRDLHDMFQKTYGLLYLQNAQIFADLFRDLRYFFRGRDFDLHEVLEKFFTVLFQRMFALLNTSYEFDKQYLRCVAENMDDLKPFRDVPQKLSVHVRRAFTAARTFLQGLWIGRNVLTRISKVDPTESCSQALTRMMYCQYCQGFIAIKPCLDYCTNVMRGCFHYHLELGDVWNVYIEAMLKVADRLKGPFNIESVIEPLDVKISDAIMNFQENSESVTSKVFQECGQPTLGSRRKRQTGGQSGVGQPQKNVRPLTESATVFDQTMVEVYEILSSSKDFWRQLALSTCATISNPLSHENNCWNGKTKARYMLETVEDGVDNLAKNPEVMIDLQQSNAVVEQQVLQLKLITSKLQNAYAGQEVNWMDAADQEDEDDLFSGDYKASISTPIPPPPHHRHHLFQDNVDQVAFSTIRSRDVYSTKHSASAERSRLPTRKSSRNRSSWCQPLAAAWTLTGFLAVIGAIHF